MKRLLVVAILASGLLAMPALAQPYQADPDTLVQSWYARFLNRQSGGEGASHWVQQLQNGESPNRVLSGIIGSTEFYMQNGQSGPGVVRAWYLDTIGQQPSQDELNYWSAHIAAVGLPQAGYDFLQQHPNSWQTVLPAQQPAYEPVASPQFFPSARPAYRPSYRPYGRPYRPDYERR